MRASIRLLSGSSFGLISASFIGVPPCHLVFIGPAEHNADAMADSTYLTKVVEPHVVSWTAKRIGFPLAPRRLFVGKRKDGTPVHFEFDGASADGKIGLLVSTSFTLKPGGTRKLHVDASILLEAPFERRIMAFVSVEALENFVNKVDGLLPLSKIEMLVCDDLPPEMRRSIEKFQTEAKAEVGDKGKKWPVAGKRK